MHQSRIVESVIVVANAGSPRLLPAPPLMMPLRMLHAAAVGALLASPLSAQSLTWNLGNFSGNANVPNGGCAFTTAGGANGQANAASCSATGSASPSLTLTAYALNGSTSSSTLQSGTVMSWGSYGVGVCSPGEYANCNTPNHATDHFGTFTDFLLLQFSSSVVLNTVALWTSGDADFSVLRWVGPGAPSSVAGTTASALSSGNWSVLTTVNGSAAGTYSLNNSSAASSVWAIAAYNTAIATRSGADAGDDAFKISGVTAAVVPEPPTIALMIAGLIGIGAVARRRRRNR